jgi:hypothetical protein
MAVIEPVKEYHCDIVGRDSEWAVVFSVQNYRYIRIGEFGYSL